MIKQESPVVSIREDLVTNTLLVQIPEEVPVQIEELKNFLSSRTLPARTRRKIAYILEAVWEKGLALRIRFNQTLDWRFRQDIQRALAQFFMNNGDISCAVA